MISILVVVSVDDPNRPSIALSAEAWRAARYDAQRSTRWWTPRGWHRWAAIGVSRLPIAPSITCVWPIRAYPGHV